MWNIFHWSPINYDHPVIFSERAERRKKKKRKVFKRGLHENSKMQFYFFFLRDGGEHRPKDFVLFNRELFLKAAFVIQR